MTRAKFGGRVLRISDAQFVLTADGRRLAQASAPSVRSFTLGGGFPAKPG
jgi:hypothetical protein